MKRTSLEVSLHIDETDHVASDEFLSLDQHWFYGSDKEM